MNFCPNCAYQLAAIGTTPAREPVTATPDGGSPEARARFLPKLRVMAEQIERWTDEQYGDWLDSLPSDEFLEFIAMGEDGVRAALQKEVRA